MSASTRCRAEEPPSCRACHQKRKERFDVNISIQTRRTCSHWVRGASAQYQRKASKPGGFQACARHKRRTVDSPKFTINIVMSLWLLFLEEPAVWRLAPHCSQRLPMQPRSSLGNFACTSVARWVTDAKNAYAVRQGLFGDNMFKFRISVHFVRTTFRGVALRASLGGRRYGSSEAQRHDYVRGHILVTRQSVTLRLTELRPTAPRTTAL